MGSRTGLSIVIIMLIFLAACKSLPGREVNKPLTPDEMAIPPGRYQNGIDIRHTCCVDQDSPPVEPILHWTHKPDKTTDCMEVIVDGDGGIWYPDGLTGSVGLTRIIRLNPDGSKHWEQQLLPDISSTQDISTEPDGQPRTEYSISTLVPVVACNGAVVVMTGWFYQQTSGTSGNADDVYSQTGFLECFDINGVLRWRTEPCDISGTLILMRA